MGNISENEKNQIKKDSKLMMDSFFEKLKKIDSKKIDDSKEIVFERDEGDSLIEKDFRDKMFRNAKSKDNDFIISEKGKW